MEFSDTYAGSGPKEHSPDGKYICAAVDCRLVIRDTETLQVVQLYSCLDKVVKVSWCPKSLYVLCGLSKRAVVQVWSVLDPDWTCKIDEGQAGCQAEAVRWTPDGQHILTVADFQIRLSIWSLANQSCVQFRGPKHAAKAISFSPDGTLLLFAERYGLKDHLTLVSCKDWTPAAHFKAATVDLVDLSWSPDGACFAAWDTALTYKLALYALDGSLLATYSAYPDALGIKTVQWAPSGQLLCIGSFDQEARILNHVTWTPSATLAHPATVSGHGGLVIYQEVVEAAHEGGEGDPESKAHFVVMEQPHKVHTSKPSRDKPKIGIGIAAWSQDGHYLVTRNDAAPGTLWIWDVWRLSLFSLVQLCGHVKRLAWDPARPRLAVCTGSSRVSVWTPEGASCVHIPLPGFQAGSLQWCPDGSSLMLSNRDTFCCAYFNQGLTN